MAKIQIRIVAIMLFIALLSTFIALWISHDWSGLLLNFGTEVGGSLLTYVLIDRILGKKSELTRLVTRLRSRDKQAVREALSELRELGWLTDGSLSGIDLSGSDLAGIDLRDAVLSNVDFSDADLKKTNMFGARLQKSLFINADLEGAILTKANLGEANLENATLTNADLNTANLQKSVLKGAILLETILAGAKFGGADLSDAYLKNAYCGGNIPPLLSQKLVEAQFDETSILPDRTRWKQDTDISRFTDPKNPDYWSSEK